MGSQRIGHDGTQHSLVSDWACNHRAAKILMASRLLSKKFGFFPAFIVFSDSWVYRKFFVDILNLCIFIVVSIPYC